MMHTIVMLTFWALAAPVAALIGFPRLSSWATSACSTASSMWGAAAGVWLTGVPHRVRRTRPVRSLPQLHLHDQSRVEYRSSDSGSAHSAPHFGHGQERTLQSPNPRKGHADRMLFVQVDRGNRDADRGYPRSQGRDRAGAQHAYLPWKGSTHCDGKLLPFERDRFIWPFGAESPWFPSRLSGRITLCEGSLCHQAGSMKVNLHPPSKQRFQQPQMPDGKSTPPSSTADCRKSIGNPKHSPPRNTEQVLVRDILRSRRAPSGSGFGLPQRSHQFRQAQKITESFSHDF